MDAPLDFTTYLSSSGDSLGPLWMGEPGTVNFRPPQLPTSDAASLRQFTPGVHCTNQQGWNCPPVGTSPYSCKPESSGTVSLQAVQKNQQQPQTLSLGTSIKQHDALSDAAVNTGAPRAAAQAYRARQLVSTKLQLEQAVNHQAALQVSAIHDQQDHNSPETQQAAIDYIIGSARAHTQRATGSERPLGAGRQLQDGGWIVGDINSAREQAQSHATSAPKFSQSAKSAARPTWQSQAAKPSYSRPGNSEQPFTSEYQESTGSFSLQQGIGSSTGINASFDCQYALLDLATLTQTESAFRALPDPDAYMDEFLSSDSDTESSPSSFVVTDASATSSPTAFRYGDSKGTLQGKRSAARVQESSSASDRAASSSLQEGTTSTGKKVKRNDLRRSYTRNHLGRFPCLHPGCSKDFSTSGHATRHIQTHSAPNPFICPQVGCGASFTRRDNCTQHQRTRHGRVAQAHRLNAA